MDYLRFIIGAILPYAALAIFLGGMTYRIYQWKKLPAPPMTLFPAPPDERANRKNTLKEAFLFRSLFKGDRLLWGIAWVFHVVLALILIGHIRVFSNPDWLLLKLGLSDDQIQALSGGVGGVAGVILLVTAALLFLRRLTMPRVREITGLSDCLALALIGAIVITGNMMRFGAPHFDLALAREYFAGLAQFRDMTHAAVLDSSRFVFHMTLAFLLIMTIPFSKILHLGGIFFTHQMIRKH